MTHRALKSSWLVVLLFAAACGGDDKKDNDDDDRSPNLLVVAVAPSAVALTQGATATATITLARPTGLGSSSVALAVGGLPAGVTAQFDNAAVSGTTATLTFTAALTATVGTSTITVTAAPDPGTGVAIATGSTALNVVAPTPLDLSGTVVLWNDAPAANAIVHIRGNGASAMVDTTTSVSGTFTAAAIVPPYDINIVFTPFESEPVNFVFLGVTEATPLLRFPSPTDTSQPDTLTANIEITGLTVADELTIAIDCPHTGETYQGQAGATSLTFDAVLAAAPTSNVNCTVRTVTGVKSNGAFTQFKNFGQRAYNFSSSGNAFDVTTAGPVSGRSITVQGREANSDAFNRLTLFWESGPKTLSLISQYEDADGTFNVFIPDDARVPVVARVGRNEGTLVMKRITSTTTSLDVTAPPLSTFVSPADAAVDVSDATVFEVTPVTGATYTLRFFDQDATRTHAIVAGGSPSFTPARLRSVAATLPQNSSMSVHAVVSTTPGSSDAFYHRSLLTQSKTDGSTAQAIPSRQFTTAAQ